MPCTDPGVPGGMQQIYTSFTVGNTVTFECDKDGFEPDFPTLTCRYNTISQQTYWEGNLPTTCIGMLFNLLF